MEELQGYDSGTARSLGAFNVVRVQGQHALEVFLVRSVDPLSRKAEGKFRRKAIRLVALTGRFRGGAFPRAESFRPWAVLLDQFMVNDQASEREIAGLKFGKNVANENVRFDAERQPVLIIRDPATAALKAFVCFQL